MLTVSVEGGRGVNDRITMTRSKSRKLYYYYFIVLNGLQVAAVAKKDGVRFGWTSTTRVPTAAEEQRKLVVVIAVVVSDGDGGCSACARTTNVCVMTWSSRFPCPAKAAATTTTKKPLMLLLLLLLFGTLLDVVSTAVSITRHHRGDVFDVSGKQLRI